MQEVARILWDGIRRDDFPARLGGDEFVVVLRGINDPQDVRAVVSKLMAQLPLPSPPFPAAWPVTFSVGFSLCPQDGRTSDELLRKADAAMYAAKSAGKNPCEQYTAGTTDDFSPQVGS